jgi:phosphate:Na+ symporter
LGLFFLGLRLIGENLRRLYGSSFRNVIKRTTHSPLFGAGLGTLAGAVMQSATAVTFILVSLTDSGLIKAGAAAPIIVWCNVGLTALAFVTTLNIHPIVAYIVGGVGIALGTLRFRSGKRLRARFSAWASFFSVWRKWAPVPLR